ncbi:hypothetical protein F0562_019633 [Nyssa sinensis]|uniref:Uncharacterized protein n=1 Tax=Nyssa sinensis TaxID=561372 RepID=A0A5J5BPQ1_9ASTE|nr:hypothetical protein F0562_019633 [Nyssa sinensis]
MAGCGRPGADASQSLRGQGGPVPNCGRGLVRAGLGAARRWTSQVKWARGLVRLAWDLAVGAWACNRGASCAARSGQGAGLFVAVGPMPNTKRGSPSPPPALSLPPVKSDTDPHVIDLTHALAFSLGSHPILTRAKAVFSSVV